MKMKANEDKTPLERVESVRNIATVELEFKAELYHRIWMEQAAKTGVHAPIHHINAFTVAPRLREDGRTYCDHCSLNMIPYKDLPEAIKDLDRTIVRSTKVVNEMWEESK